MTNLNNKLQDFPNDEINLANIKSSLIREKKLIGFIVSISTLFAIIFAYTTKPVWQGEFEIVIKNNNNNLNNNSFQNSNSLPTFLNNKSSDNETQKLILKSESVLMPVFQNVRKYYTNKGINTENLLFESWINQLKIDYENNTNVLNIKHKNKDKVLILNTLKNISKEYKEYSKKNVVENIRRTIDYLTLQKEIMENKSLNSSKDFNKFSIENGLGNIDGFITSGNNISNTDILKDELSFKNNISNNQSAFQLQTPYNPLPNAGRRYKEQFTVLERNESLYSNLSTKLKPESKTLISLKSKIDKLKSSLKKPNEILIEYKRLAKVAQRDELFLNQIEANLESAKLELVKTPKVWETISEPRINSSRISPKRSQSIIFTFLGSSFISLLLVLIKERLSGIIYNKESILDRIDCNFIGSTSVSEINYTRLLFKTLTKNYSKVGLINFKQHINFSSLKLIIDKIPNLNIYKLDNENEKNVEKLIILVEAKKLKYDDLIELNKYIKIFKEKIIGWIFLDN